VLLLMLMRLPMLLQHTVMQMHTLLHMLPLKRFPSSRNCCC
jgi:hypothetical protein